jgi:predicted short-subunit dehydrogenase-like oxidoreductase (DUF2520 family)
MARILVAGPGRVGTALAIALKNAHHTIVGAVGKNEASPSCIRFTNLVGGKIVCSDDISLLQQIITQTDILLLCVRDSEIAPFANHLASKLSFRSNQLVCHTSGASGLNTLNPFIQAGAMVGCMHPLQTFADPLLSASKLKDTFFALTGNEKVNSILENLIRDLGARSFFLPDRDKARYHAGASLASNALIALAYTAASLMPDAGGFKALLPLIEGTIANLKQIGLPDALTGPIERGDIETVLTHLHALRQDKEAKLVYEALGKVTITVASQKGSLDEETKSRLMKALQNDGKEA